MKHPFAFAIASLMASAAFSQAPVETTRTNPRDVVAARYADANSRSIEVDGVGIHYKDEGRGPVVLLIHGTFGDLDDWDDWARVLVTGHRVIRLDLPAFGTSGPIASGNYSVDRFLSLIDGFMDRLDAPRFAIAGVSYGGLVAFRYAATRTERVTALILMNSAGIQYGQVSTKTEGPQPPPDMLVSPRVSRADAEAMLLYMVGDPQRVTARMIDRKLDTTNQIGRLDEAIRGRNQYERMDPDRILAHVRAPVLVQWGGRNRVLSTETANSFVGLLRNACSVEQVVYPQGTHLMNIQIPDETVADAKRFLDAEATARCTSGK